MIDLETLKQKIIKDAKNGVPFECFCSYCGLDPKGLVNRNDSIPIIYGFDEGCWCCFRCLEENNQAIKLKEDK